MCYMVIIIITQQRRKTSEEFFNKIYTSHFIGTFVCERELETEQNCNILTPHSYGHQHCVFLILQGCSIGGPEAHSAGFLYYVLFSNFSGPQLNQGPRAPSAWCGFPYHISSITPSDL